MANGFILRGDLLARLDAARRVFVLTAKNLQQEMAVTVLDLLNSSRAFSSHSYAVS